MEAAGRRLAVMGAHLEAGSSTARSPAVRQLQTLLDHDNHELRERMKQFFCEQDIYVPRCGQAWMCVPRLPALVSVRAHARVRPCVCACRCQQWCRRACKHPDRHGHTRAYRGCPCRYDLDLRDSRELALQRLSRFCRSGFVSVTDFRCVCMDVNV